MVPWKEAWVQEAAPFFTYVLHRSLSQTIDLLQSEIWKLLDWTTWLFFLLFHRQWSNSLLLFLLMEPLFLLFAQLHFLNYFVGKKLFSFLSVGFKIVEKVRSSQIYQINLCLYFLEALQNIWINILRAYYLDPWWTVWNFPFWVIWQVKHKVFYRTACKLIVGLRWNTIWENDCSIFLNLIWYICLNKV